MHHDLHAVAVAAHVRVADELDAARCDGIHGCHDYRSMAAAAALAPAILPNTAPLVRPEPPG